MKLTYNRQLRMALTSNFATFSANDNDESYRTLNSASALLFLIVHEKERKQKHPTMEYENRQDVRDKIVEHTRHIIKGGNEPCFDLGPCWGYLPLCGAFAILHHDPDLWALFSDNEKARITQIMKMFAYVWNLGCNTKNNYGTGPSMKGNYGKWRGPNYRLTNYSLILFCADFFGGIDAVNELFLNFNYDAEISKLKEYGFTNALSCWSTPGAKEMLQNGGDAYITVEEYGSVNTYKRGTGVGVKAPYAFKDSFPHGIIHFVLNNCYSGGECVSTVNVDDSFTAEISDGTVSPMEGREGMMLEFNLEDDGLGKRSSLFHCVIDFILSMCFVATCWHLRITKLQVRNEYSKVFVGNEDVIYKMEHGYKGYSLGEPEHTNHLFSLGFNLWSNYWKDHYPEPETWR